MGIDGGFFVKADFKNTKKGPKQKSSAAANSNYFVHPDEIGFLETKGANLFFAGGENHNFSI